MNNPQFKIGQLVHHRRYDYRGVIAGCDDRCEAPEEWYRRNRTQPDRDQPWYNVLVDGGQETYVAQENLEPAADKSPVTHPLVERLFVTFHDGRYYRESFN